MYTLDTNAVIYFLSGESAAVTLIAKAQALNDVIYVPTVVRLELLSKPDMTEDENATITNFLAECRQVHLDNAIADIAADVRRLYKIKTPDSIIAATALFTGSTLVTRNARDFKKVSNLRTEMV